MKPGQPTRNESYSHTVRRAQACLARNIKTGRVPRPESCDGCGESDRELHRVIFNPHDALTYNVYCPRCWIDHNVDRTIQARKEHFEPSPAITRH
jgi:hypothetical protein